MTEWKRSPGSRLLSALLVLVVQAWLLPATAAPEGGSVSGVIRLDDGRQPLAGAVVHIADRDSGKVFSSKPSAKDGAFEVGALPSGEYELGVESAGGLYLVSVPVTIENDSRHQVELVVNGSQEARVLVGAGRKAGSAGVWSNPLTAALIVVGGAIVVGAAASAADDDDEGGVTTFN